MHKPLLEVNDLQVSFIQDKQTEYVVDKINLSLQKEQTLALIGESGSGKSITAMSIMRLLPIASSINQGSILFAGTDLLRLPEFAMRDIRGKQIAMIFQEPQTSLNPVLTVGQQIGETLARHKQLYGIKQRRRIIELLDQVEIPEPEQRIDEYPHQFSGGMKQRIMIAIALAGEPQLLIADEPTTALDVTTQAQVLSLLKQLQQDTGMSILFITHDLAVASLMADDIAVMNAGKIVEHNTKNAFYRNPKHAYSKQLIRALPTRSKQEESTQDHATEQPLLQVNNLKIHFPIKKGILQKTVGYIYAVDGVSINVRRGRTLAIVGESGSGKTTLGKGILQLLKISDGSITFDGHELSQHNKRALRDKRASMQIVFQDPYSSMNPRMMVADIIAEGMIAQHIYDTKQQRLQRVEQLLEQVGLNPSHKNRYPHEFSGGQRQRICIARALAVEPQLIICDEPTSALDVSVQAHILDLFKELQRNMGLSYLFITHNIGVVEYLAHDVAVMYQGKIVEQGTVHQVLDAPQDPYTKKLLSAVPQITLA